MRNTSGPTSTEQIATVFDMIAACAAANARFLQALALTDEAAAAEEGRTIDADDEAEREVAGEKELATFKVLLGARLTAPHAIRTRAYWIKMRVDLGDRLQEDEVDLLLDSMIETRAQRAAS